MSIVYFQALTSLHLLLQTHAKPETKGSSRICLKGDIEIKHYIFSSHLF